MAAASPILSSNLSPIIIDIRNILTTLSNLHLTTRLVWIPGHRGILGNEIADSLARSAITEGTPYDLLQASELFTIEKLKYTAATNRSLLSASERTGSIYFKIFLERSSLHECRAGDLFHRKWNVTLAGSMTGRCKPTTTLKTGKTTNLFVRVFNYKFDHKNRPENFSPSRFLLPSSPFFLVIFKVERTKNRQGLYCSRYFPQVVFVVTSSENDRVKNFPVDFRGRIYGRTRAQNDRSIFQSLVRSMNPLGYRYHSLSLALTL